MKNKYRLPYISLVMASTVLCLGSCVKDVDVNSVGPAPQHQGCLEVDGDYVDGLIRIKLREEIPAVAAAARSASSNTGIVDLDNVLSGLGASQIRRVFRDAGRYEQRHRNAGLHLWYEIAFDHTVPVGRAAGTFAVLDNVDVVEAVPRWKPVGDGFVPELIDYSALIRSVERPSVMPFDDPMLSRQWNYNNTASLGFGIEGADINLFEAWKINTGHPDVIVAVIDGGIDPEHIDIRDNLWVNVAERDGTGGQDDDNNGYIDDIHGWNFAKNSSVIERHMHGTHVGGTVAAVNNNGIGVCGVAGGDGTGNGVRLMICQAITEWYDYGFEEAFVYAADNGAVIAQCSWGNPSRYANQAMRDATDYFMEYGGIDLDGNQTGPMAGGLIIAAAGNNNNGVNFYPAALEGVVSVASIGPDYVKAQYSNYADWVSIAAPGGVDTWGSPSNILSLDINQQYLSIKGTSMACPHVSGVAALVISHFGVGNPGFTNDRLRSILMGSVRTEMYEHNPDYIGKLGVGLIDAVLALEQPHSIAPSAIGDVTVRPGAGSLTFEFLSPDPAGGGRIVEFLIYMSHTPLSGDTFDPAGHEPVMFRNTGTPDRRSSLKIGSLNEGMKYWAAIIAVDKFGNVSPPKFVSGTTAYAATGVDVSVWEGESPAGVPGDPAPEAGEIRAAYVPLQIFMKTGAANGRSFDLDSLFDDPARQDLTYNVVTSNREAVWASANERRLSLAPLNVGQSSVMVTATASDGRSAQIEFLARVLQTDQEVAVVPNQVSVRAEMYVSGNISGECTLYLSDSAGQRVATRTVHVAPCSVILQDVSGLTAGRYTLTVVNNGRRYSATFIKTN